MPRLPAILKLKGKISTGEVWVDGKPVFAERSLAVCNHSPTGFSWGYLGSGPSQLALAILLRYLSKREAVALYQDFKLKFIANLPQTDFETQIDIREWITGIRAKRVTMICDRPHRKPAHRASSHFVKEMVTPGLPTRRPGVTNFSFYNPGGSFGEASAMFRNFSSDA